MSELAQKKDESAVAWVARLGRVSTAGLSAYVLSVLASWKRDAAEKVAEAAPVLAPHATTLDAGAPSLNRVGPLDSAKQAARALSPYDLSRFKFWLSHGGAD